MEFSTFTDLRQLGSRGAALCLNEIQADPELLFCAATGSSPEFLYASLVAESRTHPDTFKRMRVVKLDEWYGPEHGSAGTCEHYLREKLTGPLGIARERYISFNSRAPDPELECGRISSALEKEGPIGLTVLGLGKNGHLGLNEPGGELQPHCHVAALSEETRRHYMMDHLQTMPQSGMTLGMSDILSSKIILLIVSGKGKEGALQTLLSGKITTRCPATFLRLHRRVHCLVMQD